MNTPISIGTATNGGGATSTVVLTTSVAGAAGDAILVSTWADGVAGDTYSVIDQAGNTYTQIQVAIGNFVCVFACCLSALALPSGQTITFRDSTGSNLSYTSVAACHVAGGLAALDVSATATQTSTGALSVGPTASTGQSSELAFVVFGAYASPGGNTYTIGSGYTALASASASGVFDFSALSGYKVLTTTGTQTATMTASGAVSDAGNIVATFTAPIADPFPVGYQQEFPHSRAGHAAALRMHHHERRDWRRRLSGLYTREY